MKRSWKWLVSALLILVMTLSVMGALAEGAYGKITDDNVNVRKKPSTGAAYWFKLDEGFMVEVLDVMTEDDVIWYKVNTNHPDPTKDNTYIGYVQARYVTIVTEGETDFVPPADSEPETDTTVPEETEEVWQGTGVEPTATIRPSTDNVFGGSFDVGIMGGATAVPTAEPTWAPEDEEDNDVTGDTTVGDTAGDVFGDSSFGNVSVANATGEITAGGTNFRIAPSTDGGLIGKLSSGTVVELVTIPAEIGEDYWYRIRYNGQEGYVQSKYVRVLTSGVTPTPAPSVYGYAKLIYDSANLRDEPAGITRATWEGKGSMLQIVGPSQFKNDYKWYPVYFGLDNKTYYVREDVISLVNSSENSGVFVTPVPDDDGDYGYVLTTQPGVNLRLKPGGETVAQIPRGVVVRCIGTPVNPENSSYTWYYVIYNNLRGYLRGDCVRICTETGGQVAATATPAPSVTNTPPVSGYGYVKLIKDKVNLRLRPAGTSQTQLAENLILPVTGAKVTSGKYDWYPVRTADGLTGYVRSDCIKVCDASGNDVAVTPTPAPGTVVTPAPGVSAYGYVQITEASTNLRNAVDGETIYQLKKGSVWPMTGLPVTYKQVTWYPIIADGHTGFVRGDCAFQLSASQEDSYLGGNGVPAETPVPTPALSSYVQTILDFVNLRESASRDAAAPYNVRTGTVMAFSEKKTVGTSVWYKVVYDKKEVWVLSTCVKVMTAAEYDAWLSQNPGQAPDTDTRIGYIVTIESGVNVRSKANGSKILTRIEKKGTILPYFGETKNVGGHDWYTIRLDGGVNGFIRADMAEKCDANGGALPTPTPAPTVTPGTSGGTDAGKQEASYSTLRLGSSGTKVKNLVTELKNQGYYTGSITSSYTSAVRDAVMAFQAAKGLTVDGIAGSETQHALYGTVPVGSGDYSNLTFEFYPVEKIDWYTGGIQQLWAKGANYKVYDVKTGIVWWAHRWSGAAHADIETLTAADTARLCQIYGVDDAQEIWDKNLWHSRPCLVTIGTRTFACSLFGMPHNEDGDTIPNNNMTGQICMHFTNSKGHDSGKVSTYHTKAIQEAYDWAKARYGAR